jgi:hypothetical protein
MPKLINRRLPASRFADFLLERDRLDLAPRYLEALLPRPDCLGTAALFLLQVFRRCDRRQMTQAIHLLEEHFVHDDSRDHIFWLWMV